MNLREEFADVAARHAAAEMAWWNGASMTYADAARHADALRPRLGGASVALVAGKSLGTYATIWAAVRDGACFVPLNPDWNVSRLVNVIGQVEPGLVACEAAWADAHADALAALGYREGAPAPAPAGEAPLRVFERQSEGARPLADYAARAGVEDLIYVIFTSGSTGVPKGVPIHRAGIDHYIRVTRETFGVEEGERWMQSVQLTFDPAIHDMFLAWSTGGTVIGIPPEHSPLGPRYVRKLEPHNWMCVPSAAGRSLSLGLLKEGSMPSLRRSFFVGESLPPDIAAAWLRATPNGELINIYGPTETTMTCTWHRFDPARDTSPVVPIGRPLAGCEVTLVDGEIVHAGPQVFGGYLSNPRGRTRPACPPCRTARAASARATGRRWTSVAPCTSAVAWTGRSRCAGTGWRWTRWRARCAPRPAAASPPWCPCTRRCRAPTRTCTPSWSAARRAAT